MESSNFEDCVNKNKAQLEQLVLEAEAVVNMSGLFKSRVDNILAVKKLLLYSSSFYTLPLLISLSSGSIKFNSTSSTKPSVDRKMPAETGTVLRFVKLSKNAFSPCKGSEKAAGFDLKSAYNYVIQPRSKEMVKTDLKIMLPEGCYGRIAPRSGLTWKNSIDVGAGVVDEDYRGDIRVILFNHSDEPFTIQAGDRIAQLICERIFYPELQEVEELSETARGSGGFGSSGKN